MFLARLVLALVDGPVRPGLLALTILQVVLPLPLITGSVHVNVGTESICLVIDPITFVYVSIDVDKFAMPMSSVIAPLALVAGAIRPHLHSVAVTETADPLTLISCTRFESVHRSLLPFAIRIVYLV